MNTKVQSCTVCCRRAKVEHLPETRDLPFGRMWMMIPPGGPYTHGLHVSTIFLLLLMTHTHTHTHTCDA